MGAGRNGRLSAPADDPLALGQFPLHSTQDVVPIPLAPVRLGIQVALGKRLHITHLDPACSKVLMKAGDLVEANISDDPHYHVATDRLA